MFGFFSSKPFSDPQLGTLVKKNGYWRGTIPVEKQDNVQLQIFGDSKSPSVKGIELAHQFSSNFDALKKQIESALFEHYLPYQEASLSGELPEGIEPPPKINSAQAVWPYVSPVYVRIEPLNGAPKPEPIIEVAFAVAWDEEHTIGARIQNWQLFELCGSVI